MRSWIRRYATHGLAVSDAAAAGLFGDAWRADGRYRVLYSGIDLSAFESPTDHTKVRRDLGIAVGAPVVGHVGRFNLQKNHRFLLQIAVAFLKLRPQAHFLLVGNGPLRPEIERQTHKLGIHKHVHFLGIRDDIPQLLRGGMDVFLFPSFYEGLPRVLIEAQAAGLRCLVSSKVTEEVAVVPGSVLFADLSAGLELWATQLDQLLRIGRVPENTALEKMKESPFSIRTSTETLCELYRTALPSSR